MGDIVRCVRSKIEKQVEDQVRALTMDHTDPLIDGRVVFDLWDVVSARVVFHIAAPIVEVVDSIEDIT